MRAATAIYLFCLAASAFALANQQGTIPLKSLPLPTNNKASPVPVLTQVKTQAFGNITHKFESWSDVCYDKKNIQIFVPLTIECWTDNDNTKHCAKKWKDLEGNIYKHIEQKDLQGIIVSEWYEINAEGSMSKIEESDIQTLHGCVKNQPSFPFKRLLLGDLPVRKIHKRHD